MSEFTNARARKANFRWQLLATVSAIALIGAANDIAKAADSDSDHPPVWIDLGGQLSRLNDGQEAFAPPLMAGRPPVLSPSQKFERPPLYSLDETGKISFEPDGTDWVLSASVRYGQSGSDKHIRQQTHPVTPALVTPSGTVPFAPLAEKFADTSAQNSEKHFIVDFQAGKDVGVGMFGGKGASSIFSLGVRFAQFSTRSNIALKSDPDFHFSYKYLAGYKVPLYQVYHSNSADLRAARSFHGIGPSLSWNASAPLDGNSKDGELAFDLGLNAAILFGRQRAQVHHQTVEQYNTGHGRYGGCHATCLVTINPMPPVDKTRSRFVTVPNIGGFAGASYRIENFKVSAGYRTDFFFGAMDGGIDAARKENVGFYGPFATVSIGVGG